MIQLKQLSEEEFRRQYYEKVGLSCDEFFEIYIEDFNSYKLGGILMIDNVNPHYGYECTFITWVELYPEYQNRKLFPEVLSKIFDFYGAKELHFECSDENLSLYLHLGAIETGISECTENHMMILEKENLKFYMEERKDGTTN